MIGDHLTPAQLSAYVARELTPAETLAASDHLAACDECRAQLLQMVGSHASATSAERGHDLKYEELVGWIDGDLDPISRRAVAERLKHSGRSRAALADLSRFRDEMNALPARDHAAKAQLSQPTSSAFSRWVLPLAAVIAVSTAAVWWATSSRRGAQAGYVKLRDGDRVIAFTSDGRAPLLAALPESASAAVAETLRSGRLDLTPEVAALVGETGTLAGPAEERAGLQVLEPVGTAVRDTQPRFRWTAAPEASGYQIHVLEETSGALIVQEQLSASTTEWQPREPLPAGQVYQWEVQALRDGSVIANSPKPPEPEARFRVLSKADVAELEEAKRVSNGSHLVMGVANAKAGLLDDALREFRILTEQNPDTELPRQLLQQLEAQRAPRR